MLTATEQLRAIQSVTGREHLDGEALIDSLHVLKADVEKYKARAEQAEAERYVLAWHIYTISACPYGSEGYSPQADCKTNTCRKEGEAEAECWLAWARQEASKQKDTP